MYTYGEHQTLRALRLHMHQPTQHVVFSRLVRVPTPTSFGDGRSSIERWFHSKILLFSPSSACSSTTTCWRRSSVDGDEGLRHLKQEEVSRSRPASTLPLGRVPSRPCPPPVSRTPLPAVPLPAHLLALNGTLTLLSAVVEGILLRRTALSWPMHATTGAGCGAAGTAAARARARACVCVCGVAMHGVERTKTGWAGVRRAGAHGAGAATHLSLCLRPGSILVASWEGEASRQR